MTDPGTDEIRDLLARAMTDAPEPRPWSDIEDRARQSDAAPPTRRRTGVWLAAAACTIALVGGLVAVVSSNGQPDAPADDPDNTAASTSTVTATSAPPAPTTLGTTETGWTGGMLDDIDVDALRPLDSFSEGDVVIPTAPSGWRVEDSGLMDGDPESVWHVDVTEAPPDNQFGQVLFLRMTREPTCEASRGCLPWGESATINGVEWQMLVVEGIPEDTEDFFANMFLRAGVGDRWVWVSAAAQQLVDGTLLEDPRIIKFLEGLRVGSPDVVTAIGEACWECGTVGAEGDPFAADSQVGASATESDGATTTIVEPRGQAPSDADAAIGRRLTDLTEGDVVIPTYIPPGLVLQPEAQIYEQPGLSAFSVTLEAADGEYSNSIRLWQGGGPIAPAPSDDPNHPRVEVAGLTWEWNDFESARITYVGSFSVWVYLHGLDRSEAERFIEGLRAIPIEQFPNPIASDSPDGLSVIDPNDSGDAEVVASDDQFELTAVQVGDQVCTKLEQTTVPATMTFAANCWETTRLTELGIVDLYPLDATDTKHLIIGVIDSPNTTAVRITSPEGASAVVPTGPGNRAIDGRFFLARLDLDASSGIRLDRFTIEDASP